MENYKLEDPYLSDLQLNHKLEFNTANTVQVGHQNWSGINFNKISKDSFAYANNPFFGHWFGRAYSYISLLNSLPSNTIIPSCADWHYLIESFGNDVFKLSIKGSSGIDLHPIGFYVASAERVMTPSSVSYWTSTKSPQMNSQFAVHFNFRRNTVDFTPVSKDWAIAARLILT